MRFSQLPYFCLLISALLAPIAGTLPVAAQSGAWQPAGGTFTRPRTLLTPGTVVSTRERLKDAPFAEIYRGVWDRAAGSAIPATGDLAAALTAKDAAFVLLMDLRPDQATGGLVLLSESERSALQEKIKTAFIRINTDVGTVVNYTDWQWKSKELIAYLCAYDLALGSGMTEAELLEGRENLQECAGNLHREATRSLLGLSFFTTIKNNHALMTAAALGTAAVVLNDAQSDDPNYQPATWLNTALWNIDNLFWVDADHKLSQPGTIAGYAEGPHYLRYAALNLLPLFRSLGNVLPDQELEVTVAESTRTVRHPFYDPNYELLWEWVARIRRPDGLLPPIGDTYVTEGFPELALTGHGRFFWPIISSSTSLAEQLYSTVDMRADFIAAELVEEPFDAPPFQALPEAGDLVFRSEWENPQAIMFRVSAKHGPLREAAGGHNQADAGSFSMFVGQEMMALDPGYVSYDRRDEVGQATNHNMILVNDQGPLIGNPGAANSADAWIERTFDLPGLDCGVVRTGYLNADITRHVLFVDDYYVLIADNAESAQEQKFTWQLHGNGRAGIDSGFGTCTFNAANREAIWQRNGAALTAHFLCDDPESAPSYTATEAVHEEAYNVVHEHTVTSVSGFGTKRQFIAGLAPRALKNDTDFESTWGATGTTLISRVTGNHTVFSQSRTNEWRTIPASEVALPGSVGTDAHLLLLTIDPLSNAPPDQMLMLDGSSLAYNNREYLSSEQRTDLAVIRLEAGEYVGYCRDSGRIIIAIDDNFTDVIGNDVESWTMLWATARVAIDMKSGGYFRITSTSAVRENPPRRPPVGSATLTVVRREGRATQFSVEGMHSPESTVRLYDIAGRLVHSVPLPETGTAEANLAELPAGTFFCVLQNSRGTPIAETQLLILP